MSYVFRFALAVLLGPGLAHAEARPAPAVLDLAVSGCRHAAGAGEVDRESPITVIDYSLPSTRRRLFVIDPDSGEVLHATLVAHGKNSGENLATRFGNESGSLMSSLGFYVTGETYRGRHGYSLRLRGLEPGFNDNAAARFIVIHGADYVSDAFIERYGRLGRSWGCPALPDDSAREIIDRIKDGTCLFVFAEDSKYLSESVYVVGSSDP